MLRLKKMFFRLEEPGFFLTMASPTVRKVQEFKR
jgi:hypothetical protein